jgi:hypothetical protein
MTPGLTSTGAVLEAMILPALRLGGYEYETQVLAGDRIGGRKHKVDALARRGDARVLVSLKWQQTSGTTEQQVPFEVICLAEAVTSGIDDVLDPSMLTEAVDEALGILQGGPDASTAFERIEHELATVVRACAAADGSLERGSHRGIAGGAQGARTARG